MEEAVLAEPIMDRLRRKNPAYHETAYVFVLAGLQFTLSRLGEARHVSGRELAEGCRDLALERWGPMAREVLSFWGIRTTRDLGEIVFALVDCEVLVRQETDAREEFDDLFCFERVFEREYPWRIPAGLAS